MPKATTRARSRDRARLPQSVPEPLRQQLEQANAAREAIARIVATIGPDVIVAIEDAAIALQGLVLESKSIATSSYSAGRPMTDHTWEHADLDSYRLARAGYEALAKLDSLGLVKLLSPAERAHYVEHGELPCFLPLKPRARRRLLKGDRRTR